MGPLEYMTSLYYRRRETGWHVFPSRDNWKPRSQDSAQNIVSQRERDQRIEGRTNDTNTIIARHTTGPGDGSTINSTGADASTARLNVLFRIDALERVLQSRDWTLAVRGIIARYITTYATRPSRSSDRIRGHG